jgi:integrase
MSDNRITEAELLMLLENGNIDTVTVANLLSMVNKKAILEQHPYSIWQSTDGYWKTKLKGDDGVKRQIKRKSKTDIEDVIVEYYKSHSQEDYTFKARFNLWIDRQRDCARSENTILKYKSDYRRFFEGYPLEDIDIRQIDEIVLSQHILRVLKDKQIPWRALKDIMGYTNGTFEKAVRDRVIEKNPFLYIDLEIYKKYCYISPVKTTVQRTLTESDTHILFDRIQNPRAHNINRICCFAIEMALYTGMRVGELAGLMWEDIILDEGLIFIRHSEKYNRSTKESIVTTTKTGKERIFPLTKDIKDLLTRIKEYETAKGWIGDFVFMDAEGRVSKSKISDTTRNITMSDDFTGIKSIHAIRRTINSRMRCNGVSATLASSLIGNTERVNDRNYTYDITDLEEKREIIDRATQGNPIRYLEMAKIKG